MGQHVASIKAAENLSIGDVRCRYLRSCRSGTSASKDSACTTRERDATKARSLGGTRYTPVGFWATRLRQTKTAEEAIARLREFLAGDL